MVEDRFGRPKIVVAGGEIGGSYHKTSEILDLQTLEWSSGPDLPVGLAAGGSVPYKKTFLIVGGDIQPENMNSNVIYEYDGILDAWITWDEVLATARQNLAAFLVPDEAVNCS